MRFLDGTQMPPYIIWADNVYLLARDARCASCMLRILDQCLHTWGLFLKKEELSIMHFPEPSDIA
eukprot:12591317-Alexandrium_andersonii.AAC.1